MQLDRIDLIMLNENFDRDIINQLDMENVNKIYNYLIDNGIYYAKDIFMMKKKKIFHLTNFQIIGFVLYVEQLKMILN